MLPGWKLLISRSTLIFSIKNNKQFVFSKLGSDDFDRLSEYLQQLSDETKRRFGPHKFDSASIAAFFQSSGQYVGYIARDTEEKTIIAYLVIKIGYLEHDRLRLASYGIQPDPATDCVFAPSVADNWQSFGIGTQLLQQIISEIKLQGVNRIILWGGVQADNEKAVKYYLKNEFQILGQFSYNGENYDMMRVIT